MLPVLPLFKADFVVLCLIPRTFVYVQRFNVSMEHSKNISEFTNGFLHKLMEESGKLQSHVTSIDDIQTRSIVEFQKAYEVNLSNLEQR